MDKGPVEILLVEDNPTDEELALRALAKNRVANNVHVVRDGAEALDYLFCRGPYSGRLPDYVPRVVLLDLKLPLVDGLEVLRQVKATPRTREIPVVVLTSSREERDIVECYKLGANSYVVKPIDFSEFTEFVRHLGRYWVQMNVPPFQAFSDNGGPSGRGSEAGT